MEKAVKKDSKILLVLQTLMITYVVTGILLLILTLILYKFKISESQIGIGVIAIYIIANVLGGFLIGRIKKEKRFLWGLIIGLSYFVILSLVSFIVNRSFYDDAGSTVTALLICTFGGMFGGMVS